MLSSDPFYHNILRKTTVGFGNVFKDIHILRKVDSSDESSQETERFKVPLQYGPKQKWLARLNSTMREGDLTSRAQVKLPIMSFELTNISYDSTRKTNSKTTRAAIKDSQLLYHRFNRIPYNIDFALHVYSKNLDDALQIVEQVLAFFKPEFTIAVNLTSIDENVDMNITYEGFTIDDSYEGQVGSDTRRVIMTLTFKVQSYIIGPISDSAPILQVDTNFLTYDNDGEDETVFETMIVTPPVGATTGTELLPGATGYGIQILQYENGLTT